MIQYPALLISFLKMVLKNYKVFRGDGNNWEKAGKAPFHFTANSKHWVCKLSYRLLQIPGSVSFLTTQVAFTRSNLCCQKLIFSMPSPKSWQPFPYGTYLIIVKQGTYSSQCRGWDMRQVQCRGEPFPKPALSILDPDCSIPGLFGALFRGYFSLPQSGHLWDWLLHWLFHYCHTPFCPLKTGITQTRRFSPQNNLSPISDLPLCWCEERTLKTQAVPWHCPAEAAALGQSCALLTDLFSSFVGLYTSFPLFVGREGSGERGVSIWIGLFFGCCFKEIHHQHPDKKKGSTCQAH